MLRRRSRAERGQRTYWTADLTPRRPKGAKLRFWRDIVIGGSNRGHTTDPSKANLISSRTDTGWHMPVLDMDMPHRLEPSSRLGHSHLYIDVRMPWRKYAALLIHTPLSRAAAKLTDDEFHAVWDAGEQNGLKAARLLDLHGPEQPIGLGFLGELE